jgi:hypothetical protein
MAPKKLGWRTLGEPAEALATYGHKTTNTSSGVASHCGGVIMNRHAGRPRPGILLAVLALSMSSFSNAALAQMTLCPADSPSGDEVATAVLDPFRQALNMAWDHARVKIDPIDPTGSPPFESGTETLACPDGSDDYCLFHTGLTVCDKVTAYLNGYNYTGLSNLELTFDSLSSVTSEPKNVALHSARGPDAGKITDGTFAPEGTAWSDTRYAVRIPFTGSAYALTVDFGSVFSTVCGAGVGCQGPLLQADNNPYQLDYSIDGISWQCYGQFAPPGHDGLRTRGASKLTGVAGCPATLPATFPARYVRVSALPGSGDYAVSELLLTDAANPDPSLGSYISWGRRAVGPAPAQITSGTPPPNGTVWDDARAIVINDSGANGVVVDLLDTLHVCGASCGPLVQATHNDTFQLDYSTDGITWTPYGQIPPVGGTDLQTRAVAPINPSSPNPDFDARYVRVWAIPGDGAYSVSQITLRDTSNNLIAVEKPTYGPEPFATNGIRAREGTEWNDARYATILPPCNPDNPINDGLLCPGSSAMLSIDLGPSVPGPITQITLQANHHEFRVDLSSDGVHWRTFATFPAVSTDGLTTRVVGASDPAGGAGRYLRVVGVPTDNDTNYSVSEVAVQTSTPVNTPCSYSGAYNANAGENFSCSYEGQFAYGLTVPPTSVSFTVHYGEVRMYCHDDLGISDSVVIESDTGATCTATLTLDSTTSNPIGGDYCAGTCAGGDGTALSYAQFPTDEANPHPAFIASNAHCTHQLNDLFKFVGPMFEAVANAAVSPVLNGILASKPGLLPFPTSCEISSSTPVAVSKWSFKGLATGVGTGQDDASVQISGRFTSEQPLELHRTTFTLNALLGAVGGVGELVRDSLGSGLGPLTLLPRADSTAKATVFETPAGITPSLRMELKTRNAKKKTIDFELSVDGATIPAAPDCSGRPHPKTKLTTAFFVSGPDGHGASVATSMNWRCKGAELRAN